MIQENISVITPLTSNSASLVFPNTSIRTGSCCGCDSWLCTSNGSANFEITKAGIYEIDFNATVSSATAGDVALGIFSNGELISGSLMAESLAAADDYANVSATTKVRVCCNGSTTISVRSVPALQTPTTPTTIVDTQIPIIVSAEISISRLC